MITPSTSVQNDEFIYQTFYVNASLTCVGTGNDACGDINATLQYNVSGAEPDSQISTSVSATPFFADDGIKSCVSLNATDQCNVSWVVNATGTTSSNIVAIGGS